MPLLSQQFGNPSGEAIVTVSGFGDNGTMYDGLAHTALADDYLLVVTDLPGCGDAKPDRETLSLDRCAELIANVIAEHDAGVIVGHSLGSIIASLAAARTQPQVHTVISIEGNLTPEDAYFSGSAAQYATPEEFRVAFLLRLDDLARESEVVRRYRAEVARADPRSLWELGCDAHRFSASNSAGDVLMASAPRIHYLYNPDNAPAETNAWLDAHPDLPRTLLPGASHWAMVDEPDRLAGVILQSLSDRGRSSVS